MPISFIANREVRVIPKGWRHPKGANGRFKALLPADDERKSPGGRRDWFRESGQAIPDDAFMPDATGQTEIAAYETTSEGTPISPAFPDSPEGRLALTNWCAENATTFGSHRADAEAWAGVLFGEASAAVDPQGRVTFA